MCDSEKNSCLGWFGALLYHLWVCECHFAPGSVLGKDVVHLYLILGRVWAQVAFRTLLEALGFQGSSPSRPNTHMQFAT